MERNCEAYCQSCDGSLESEIRDARRRCGSLHRAEHFARIIEVGDEVYDAFKESGFDMSLISMKKKETGKYHIDLWEANRIELLNAGVPAEQIEVAGICTYIHHDEFFSARRLGIDSGRILSGIMIRK